MKRSEKSNCLDKFYIFLLHFPLLKQMSKNFGQILKSSTLLRKSMKKMSTETIEGFFEKFPPSKKFLRTPLWSKSKVLVRALRSFYNRLGIILYKVTN